MKYVLAGIVGAVIAVVGLVLFGIVYEQTGRHYVKK